MTTARTLLNRVRKLEQVQESPMWALIGGEEGWARFEADAAEGIVAGRYDGRDMPVVVAVLRGWLGVTSGGN